MAKSIPKRDCILLGFRIKGRCYISNLGECIGQDKCGFNAGLLAAIHPPYESPKGCRWVADLSINQPIRFARRLLIVLSHQSLPPSANMSAIADMGSRTTTSSGLSNGWYGQSPEP